MYSLSANKEFDGVGPRVPMGERRKIIELGMKSREKKWIFAWEVAQGERLQGLNFLDNVF